MNKSNYIKGFFRRKISSLNLEFENISYSQEGEDLILSRIFEGKDNGFFIDIGAHHPIRFSNTFKFYKKGWRGINIDAMPGSMNLFQKIRPEDLNLESPISDVAEEILFYIFKENALNTFDEHLAKKYIEAGWELIRKEKLMAKTVADILTSNSIKRVVDFLSIDVEGFELKVLQSFDWSLCSPNIILIEDLEFDFQNIKTNGIYNFIIDKQYRLLAKTLNTVFYQKISHK